MQLKLDFKIKEHSKDALSQKDGNGFGDLHNSTNQLSTFSPTVAWQPKEDKAVQSEISTLG